MTDHTPMQRLLAAAGWDAGSIRHKQLEDALDGAGLHITEDAARRAEPVAWRWKYNGQWYFGDRPAPQDYPSEPLYADGTSTLTSHEQGTEK